MKNAVLRFSGQPRGRRMDTTAALTALLLQGFCRTRMTRFHILQDGTGEQCTWEYAHADGRTASLRVLYPYDTEEN